MKPKKKLPPKPPPKRPKPKAKVKPAVTSKAPSKRSAGPKGKPVPARKGKPKTPQKGKKRGKKPAPKPARRKPRPDPRRWYVVAVETGTDGKARKGIIRKKNIESLEKKIGRILSPFQSVEKVVPAGGEVVACGHCLDPWEAKQAGNLKAWELVDAEEWQKDPKSCPDGHRVRITPAKSQTKGKVGNGWDWVVKEEKSMVERTIHVRERKYPGYLLVHMKMDEETFHVVKGVRGVMYFLMSDEKPTELESEEAARLLVEQAAQNRAVRDRKKEEVILDYGVGDEVVAVDGAWKDMGGKVLKIEGTPPKVTVGFTVWGKPVPVSLNHREVKKRG